MSKNDQNDLYRQRTIIDQELGYHVVEKNQIIFLFNYFRNHKKTFIWLVVFMTFQVFLEILFFSISHNVISVSGRVSYQRFSTVFLVGSLVTIIAYVVTVYASIYFERKYVLNLTNKLRERMFANMINKEASKSPSEERMTTISKISYHLSLFTLGLDNVGVSLLMWMFYFGAVIVYIAVFNFAYLMYTPIILILSIILYCISYLISTRIITREAASYSKIVNHIVYSVFNYGAIKKLKRESSIKFALDEVVKVDTHFRIRRDIWIRYSSRVVVILVAIIAVLYSLLTNFHQIKINVNGNLFLQGVLAIYTIRILYLSVRCGIYTTPFKIGIALCVPKLRYTLHPIRRNWEWKEITISSNKVRLFLEAKYWKDFKVVLQKGKRHLYYAPRSYAGKTALAELFAGHATYTRHSFLVKVDRARMAYNEWSDSFASKYLFSVYVSTYTNVAEYIFAKRNKDITSLDIESLQQILESNPIFSNFRLTHDFITSPLEKFASNYTTLFHIHLLYALLHKPELIVIDNIWPDLNHDEINNAITFLNTALPESTLVIFARNRNSLVAYDEIFEINDEITKVNI